MNPEPPDDRATPSAPPASSDDLYVFDEASQKAIAEQKPWTRNPHYFKKCVHALEQLPRDDRFIASLDARDDAMTLTTNLSRHRVKISALALMKMTQHCERGGEIEVMGTLLGQVRGDAFVVTDAFELPVEGTETRVNAQAEAYEYMVEQVGACKRVGRMDNVVGWYHSHPGYGCWLSGIDVNTQMLNQRYNEPFLAIVIDPTRTSAQGKVEIGAFRTYPEGYVPPDEASTSKQQTIPLNKVEDFGVHANKYYALDVSFFKSSLDAKSLDPLWEQYWVNTLSSSPFLNNRRLIAGQAADIVSKITNAETTIKRGGAPSSTPTTTTGAMSARDTSALAAASRDAVALAAEQSKSFATHAIRRALFGQSTGQTFDIPMQTD